MKVEVYYVVERSNKDSDYQELKSGPLTYHEAIKFRNDYMEEHLMCNYYLEIMKSYVELYPMNHEL
jgi:hypothetical protein